MTDTPPEHEREHEEAEDPGAAHARVLSELIAGNREKQRAQAERLGFRTSTDEETRHD